MNGINNQMINLKALKSIFDNRKVYIPLLQRNYKWSQEEAAKLAADLWDSYMKSRNSLVGSKEGENKYTVGMITLYEEESGRVQLIDGQQRIITLTLLLKLLNAEENYFNFEFERDIELEEKKKRSYFINECLKCRNFNVCKKQYEYTDIRRFKDNYNAIRLPITSKDLDGYIKLIKQLEINVKYIKDENDRKKVEQLTNEFSLKIEEDENLLKEEMNKLGLKTSVTDFVARCKRNIFARKLSKRIFDLIIDDNFIEVEINKTKIEKIIQKHGIPINESYIHKHVSELRYAILKKFPNLHAFEGEIQQFSIRKSFIEYILDNVFILFHVTSSKPIDEFLNINKNKTSFVISDYIKANLIIDTKQSNEERSKIVELFQDLSTYFYSNENKDIWKLISKGYQCLNDENRLKLLFCDRYDHNDKNGYQYEKEYKRLLYYLEILKTIKEEINLSIDLRNWNSYNAFCCLYQCKKVKFFEMFGKEYDENVEKMRLEEVIWSHFNLEAVVYNQLKSIEDKNFFLESQLYTEMKEIKNDYNFPDDSKDGWAYLLREEDMKDLDDTIKEYIAYMQKRNNITISM